jgi:hypothetical protein
MDPKGFFARKIEAILGQNVKTVATEGAAMRSDEAAQPSSQD